METAFDFNEKFGAPKKLLCKNFNKIQISIHPDFSGIYLCYQEAFKSLKADLSILTSYPEIRVWKDLIDLVIPSQMPVSGTYIGLRTHLRILTYSSILFLKMRTKLSY
jgi:hypothetical protein